MPKNKFKYYRVLELQTDASLIEIKQAYRTKANQFHPDKNSSKLAAKRFQEINEAYQTLSNKKKKKIYDYQQSGEDLLFNYVNDEAQNDCDLSHLDELYEDIVLEKQESITKEHLELSVLLELYNTSYTVRTFYQRLKDMKYVIKDIRINNNEFILIGEGLKYGINLIYDSQSVNTIIPDWYISSTFGLDSLSLESQTRYDLTNMTKILFKQEMFESLLLAIQNYENSAQEKCTILDTYRIQDYKPKKKFSFFDLFTKQNHS